MKSLFVSFASTANLWRLDDYNESSETSSTGCARPGSSMQQYATASSCDWFGAGDWVGLQTDKAHDELEMLTIPSMYNYFARSMHVVSWMPDP